MRHTPNSVGAREDYTLWLLVFLIPRLDWAGILFKHIHALRTLQNQLIWEWTAECWEQQCLRVISLSKIQKKSWLPKSRSWTHSCGLLPGPIKSNIQVHLLTHHQQPKIWKEHWMESKEVKEHNLPSPSSGTFLCHTSLVSLDFLPIHKDPHFLFPRP